MGENNDIRLMDGESDSGGSSHAICSSSSLEQEEILKMWRQMDEKLESKAKAHNLSAINVKSILNHMIKNPQVISVIMGLDMDSSTPDLKLTRSKTKQTARNFDDVNLVSRASRTFLDINYENEDDDADYIPEQDEAQSDTEMEAEAEAELDAIGTTSSIQSLCTPNIEEVDVAPALHTRSKFQEHLETPPDSGPIFGEDVLFYTAVDDPEYLEFINNLNDPSKYDADEVDDPEYNFLADDDAEFMEDDEIRKDRATEIPLREVENLLQDLIDSHLLPTDLYAETSMIDPFQIIETIQPLQSREVLDNEDSELRENVEEVIKEESKTMRELPLEVILVDAKPSDAEKTSLKSATLFGASPENPPAFTIFELQQLIEQLTKHVQLLTQMSVNCIFEKDSSVLYNGFQEMINALYELKANRSENSFFNIRNLNDSVVTCHTAWNSKSINCPIPLNEKDQLDLPPPLPQVAEILAHSSALIFPELLPTVRMMCTTDSYSRFSDSEECLLLMGLIQFKHVPHTTSKHPEGRYYLIIRNLLANKTCQQIRYFIKNCRKGRTKMHQMISNYERRELKLIFPLDDEMPTVQGKPITWSRELQPRWLQCLADVEIARNRIENGTSQLIIFNVSTISGIAQSNDTAQVDSSGDESSHLNNVKQKIFQYSEVPEASIIDSSSEKEVKIVQIGCDDSILNSDGTLLKEEGLSKELRDIPIQQSVEKFPKKRSSLNFSTVISINETEINSNNHERIKINEISRKQDPIICASEVHSSKECEMSSIDVEVNDIDVSKISLVEKKPRSLSEVDGFSDTVVSRCSIGTFDNITHPKEGNDENRKSISATSQDEYSPDYEFSSLIQMTENPCCPYVKVQSPKSCDQAVQYDLADIVRENENRSVYRTRQSTRNARNLESMQQSANNECSSNDDHLSANSRKDDDDRKDEEKKRPKVKKRFKRRRQVRLRDGLDGMLNEEHRLKQTRCMSRVIFEDFKQRMFMHQEKIRAVQEVIVKEEPSPEVEIKFNLFESIKNILGTEQEHSIILLSFVLPQNSLPDYIFDDPLRKMYEIVFEMMYNIEAFAIFGSSKFSARSIFRYVRELGPLCTCESLEQRLREIIGAEGPLWDAIARELPTHNHEPRFLKMDYEFLDLTCWNAAQSKYDHVDTDLIAAPVMPKRRNCLFVNHYRKLMYEKRGRLFELTVTMKNRKGRRKGFVVNRVKPWELLGKNGKRRRGRPPKNKVVIVNANVKRRLNYAPVKAIPKRLKLKTDAISIVEVPQRRRKCSENMSNAVEKKKPRRSFQKAVDSSKAYSKFNRSK